MANTKCPRCLQPISTSDSLAFHGDEIIHLDCRRPRNLSPDERVLLFTYCFDHEAAGCLACGRRFRQYELLSDPSSNHAHLCPRCCTDLTESLRAHLYTCAALPEEVRQASRAVRDVARRLVKQSDQLRDHADVLMREAEAAIAALHATMRRRVFRG